MTVEAPADGPSSVQEPVEPCRDGGTVEEPNQPRAISTITLMLVILAAVASLADVGSTLWNRGHFGETEPHYRQGLDHERKGEYEEAIVSYQEAIDAHPERPAAYNALAWLYADKLETNLDYAITLAQKAVELTESEDDHPSRDYWLAECLDTLGWAYYKDGEYTEAVETLERAIALHDRESFTDHLDAAINALNSLQEGALMSCRG